MNNLKFYIEDLKIAKALIQRDEGITRRYFYLQCYPLFKSIYDNYYTDCVTVKEFIDEIYVLIMTPSKITGKCQLENFRGESSLSTWIKTVCLFYCYEKFEKKNRLPIAETVTSDSVNAKGESDRLLENSSSTDLDFTGINRKDVEVILSEMPNERYRTLIRLRYLENMTNEETAKALGMTMANYYNKHKLAKEQYEKAFRKEGKDGK